MNMELRKFLEKQDFELADILSKFKFSDIKSQLEELVSKPDGYNFLKNNPIANNNFFALLSHVFLIEQNQFKTAKKVDEYPLSVKTFNEGFTERVTTLAKRNEAAQKLFK